MNVLVATGDLSVRQATEADAAAVNAWLADELLTAWSLDRDSRPNDPTVVRGIVSRATRDLGYVQWFKIESDTAGVDLLLAPDAWGARTGSAILSAVVAHLFAQGNDRVVMQTNVSNTRAIRSYERAGFNATRTDGDQLVMERRAFRLNPWTWRRGGAQVIPLRDGWKIGGDPPWREGGAEPIAVSPLLQRIAERGAGSAPKFHVEDPRRSAVLIALSDGDRGTEVLLTRRSWALKNHRGEVSFPGGRTDPGESAVETALREASEEIGLDPATVEVVGELDHIATVVSSSIIVPVVARLRTPVSVQPMTMEVDRILTVPLVDFLRPHTYREERWGLDWERAVHFFELDDETVWGATGRMMFQLLSIATGVSS